MALHHPLNKYHKLPAIQGTKPHLNFTNTKTNPLITSIVGTCFAKRPINEFQTTIITRDRASDNIRLVPQNKRALVLKGRIPGKVVPRIQDQLPQEYLPQHRFRVINNNILEQLKHLLPHNA